MPDWDSLAKRDEQMLVWYMCQDTEYDYAGNLQSDPDHGTTPYIGFF